MQTTELAGHWLFADRRREQSGRRTLVDLSSSTTLLSCRDLSCHYHAVVPRHDAVVSRLVTRRLVTRRLNWSLWLFADRRREQSGHRTLVDLSSSTTLIVVSRLVVPLSCGRAVVVPSSSAVVVPFSRRRALLSSCRRRAVVLCAVLVGCHRAVVFSRLAVVP